MVSTAQRNKNTNDTSVISLPESVGDVLSVKILDANDDRMYIAITARNKDIWLKLQPAATDDLKIGIFVPKDATYELHPDIIYTGEISAISQNAIALVYATEF